PEHLGVDESPTKQAAAKSWLGTFGAGLLTAFAARGTRAATVSGGFLTDVCTGVVVCDRARMDWGLGRLQGCWAHLARGFQAPAHSEDGVVRRLGHERLRPTRAWFRPWNCRRGGACVPPISGARGLRRSRLSCASPAVRCRGRCDLRA